MSGAVLEVRSDGPDETRRLAGLAAAHLAPGDVVALTGELGAGKTCFVQGAAAALGVTRRVTSPTFTLVRTYEGRGGLPLVHVDVYRLDHLNEVRDLGEDVFGPDQVTFVEWGDAVEPLLPEDRLEVELRLGDGDDERAIRLRGLGSWQARLELVARAVGHDATPVVDREA